MAFLTSQRGSGKPNVAEAFDAADVAAVMVKRAALQVRDKAIAGTMTSEDVLDSLVGILVDCKARLEAVAAVQGIAAYAQEQYADVPGYDVTTNFTGMMTEISNTITFLIQGYPRDGDGNLKKAAWNPDNSGRLIPFSGFSAGQRQAFADRLNALIATID